MTLLARLIALFLLGGVPAMAATPTGAAQFTNVFTTPEEVVAYYCARDARGHVWTGLLESERLAFTEWKTTPQADSFFVARDYKIQALSPVIGSALDRAQIEVRYRLVEVADAAGSRTPAGEAEHRVVFDLKKIQGRWKIVGPDPATLSPVVVESLFHF